MRTTSETEGTEKGTQSKGKLTGRKRILQEDRPNKHEAGYSPLEEGRRMGRGGLSWEGEGCESTGGR